MSREAVLDALDQARARVRELEAELDRSAAPTRPPEFYWPYHVLAGFSLGIFGAAASLLFNIVGSLLVNQDPLKIIRIYLTFPLGEAALNPDAPSLWLAIGCCLYLATGMLLGIPFHLVLRKLGPGASFAQKLVVVSGLALLTWAVAFYGVLSWLQPLWFGGRWIVDLVPWWVGATTHLVFGWTMLLVQPLGTFAAYTPETP